MSFTYLFCLVLSASNEECFYRWSQVRGRHFTQTNFSEQLNYFIKILVICNTYWLVCVCAFTVVIYLNIQLVRTYQRHKIFILVDIHREGTLTWYLCCTCVFVQFVAHPKNSQSHNAFVNESRVIRFEKAKQRNIFSSFIIIIIIPIALFLSFPTHFSISSLFCLPLFFTFLNRLLHIQWIIESAKT